MPDTLPVHVNRGELHGVEVPNTFETTGSFVIELHNHGEPLHVHLHLDDDLSTVATLEANNHYVEAETERQVQVDVRGPAAVRGKLKVVSAYGATTRYVDVIITEPDEQKSSVRVDESLNKPQPRKQSATAGPGQNSTAGSQSMLADRPEIGVLALGGVALLIATWGAIILQNTAVVLGALAVLAGVLVAVYMLVQ